MKVLVATSTLQGKRLTDHFHCSEGELVWMAPLCPDDVSSNVGTVA
jgi:hypothetical protein